jgi:hypothetical protein
MDIIQWIQSVVKRPFSSLTGSSKEIEEDLPLEHDPVGEFLENKKKGINLSKEEVSEAPPVANVPPRAVGQTTEAGSGSMAGTEKVEAVAQPAEGHLEGPIQSDLKVETPVAVLPDGEKKKVSQAEGEANEAPSETKVEPQGLESGSRKIEAANTSSTNNPQEDEKIESVLDVFRTEELAVDTTSTLSKELSDTSVYSLLEESKQVAQIAKQLKKEHSE